MPMYIERSLTLTAIEELPTAYNEDIKKFYRWGCEKKRDSIMKQMKEKLLSKRINFNSLFPNRTKRKDILGQILLLTSVSGIAVVRGERLAEIVGCTADYVYKSMKNIKDTGEIIVTGLADGSNKYVFVLKSHENFKRIIKEVFYMDIAEQSTEPESSINAVGMASNDDNTGSQSLRSSITKQEKSVIQHSIEDEITSVINTAESIEQAEMYLTAYIDNPNQLWLFHNIHEIPYPEEIQKHAAVLVMRAGSRGTLHLN